VVCVLVAAALLGLERADTGAPLNAVPVAAKVKPTTTTSSTSSTSSTSTTSTSTTSTTIKHCDDGTGIDNPQNKHCRPPSPHS
jgi:hypothetical protein